MMFETAHESCRYLQLCYEINIRSADHSVNMFDRRNLTSGVGVGSPVHKFEDHKAAVLCVQVL